MHVRTETFDLDLYEPVSPSEIDDALALLEEPEPALPPLECSRFDEALPLPPLQHSEAIELNETDILETLPPLEELWAGCAETVKHDYDGCDDDGVGRVVHDYLALEQRGALDELPAVDQQRVIRQLAKP